MLLEYPTRKGLKSGLFKSRIGLNLRVVRNLFHYGKIRIECVGDLDDGSIIQGWSERPGQHSFERIRLPEALKRERTRVFVGKYLKKLESTFYTFNFCKNVFEK